MGCKVHGWNPPLPERYQQHSAQEIQLCKTILQDYLSAGAVRELSLKEAQKSMYSVPWFVHSKPEGLSTNPFDHISINLDAMVFAVFLLGDDFILLPQPLVKALATPF